MSITSTNRKIHKWGSIIIALPLLVILATGILLLLKKELSFIQPPTAKGSVQHSQSAPEISFDDILAAAQSVPDAQITTWQDIDRLDVRPSKGIVKIRSHNSIEIQIDSHSGDIIQIAQRNSDLIESIHDGTFFQKNANLWLMLPAALTALTLLITGLVLFFSPYVKRHQRRRKSQ